MVCSAAAELLVANQTAEQILQAHDGLELDSDGTLAIIHGETTSLKNLVRRVAETTRGHESGSRDSAFAVQRGTGKRPLTLFVRAVNTKMDTPVPNEAAVLVMILDSALPIETTEAELRQLYGLTATEARLANHLMEGLAARRLLRSDGDSPHYGAYAPAKHLCENWRSPPGRTGFIVT